MLPLAHPNGFAVSDVSIDHDGDGYLQYIAHALIDIVHVWSICLTFIPGGTVFWVPCKHKGNYMWVVTIPVMFTPQ